MARDATLPLAQPARTITHASSTSQTALLVRLVDAMFGWQTRVVVDLADTPMLSSAVLTALLRLGTSLRSRGGDLTVRSGSDGLVHLLEMTLLSSSFTLERARPAGA